MKGLSVCKRYFILIIVLVVFLFVKKTEVSAETLTLTLERFTTGGGFIVEPTVVEFEKGDTYEDILRNLLETLDYTYSYTYTQNFYLAGIDNVDTGIENMPNCIRSDILGALNVMIIDNSKAPGLYEKSYTEGSGWMYYVNNEYMNAMNLERPVQDDVVRFMFTLWYGADLTGQLRDFDGNVTKTFYEPADKTELVRLMGQVNQNRKSWENCDGFDEAYDFAVETMATMDADEGMVNEAISWLNSVKENGPKEPEEIKVNPSQLCLSTESQPYTLNYRTIPEKANVVSVIWSSSNEAVVSVDENGTLVPHSTGEAKIQCTVNGTLTSECSVTVLNPVEEVYLEQTEMVMYLEEDGVQINYTYAPDSSYAVYQWSSSDSSVASVSSRGLIEAKKVGTTDIILTADTGAEASCHVTVLPSRKQAFLNGMTQVTVKASHSKEVVLHWNAYEFSDRYIISRRAVGDVYSEIASVTGLSYVDTTVEPDTKYYYIVAAASSYWGDEIKSKFDTGVWVKTPKEEINVEAVSIATIQSAAFNKLKISWKLLDNIDGYVIYRATSSRGNYNAIRIITDLKTNFYIDTGLTTGRKYYYKIRAFRMENGEKLYGEYSEVKYSIPALDKTNVTVKSKKNAATLKWKKVKQASGYVVYRAAKKNGKYKAVKTIKKRKIVTYTDKKLKSKKTYYYKVRAYRKVNGKKVFGKYSAVKKVKVK